MIEKKKPSDDFIRIQDLWGMFVPKWHWFAISLFITLAVAMLYLLSTPPIYTRYPCQGQFEKQFFDKCNE